MTSRSGFLDRVRQATNTMDGLVRDLLDIVWIDSSQILEIESVNIGQILQTSIDLLKNHANKRNISIIITSVPKILPQNHR